ncbi:MAG TPA: PLP-dependent aminotransferase family protein [Gemmataceae bacterium]|jgi:2-aminoadipate transaminase
MPPPSVRLSGLAARTPEQPISHFMKVALENPGLISLAAGFVDEDSLPAETTAAALADLLGRPDSARAALQYGSTQGHPPLRAKLLDRLAAADGTTPAGLGLAVEDVVVTTGSQQLLYIVAELLLDPGDIVVTEAPSYFVYHAALAGRGAEVIPVPMDAEGMDTDALEAALCDLDRTGRLERLKLIYTIDYFQNPTGLTLSAKRRQRLMELVRQYSRRHRIVVLEDAAYRELRFSGPDVPSLKSLDPDNEYVIYTSTFSKPCAPGIRMGCGVVPRDLMAPLLRLKGSHDFGSANLAQYLADRLLESGAYEQQVAVLRDVYQSKCRATTEALAAEFREWPAVRWTQPAGGLYVWLTFPPAVGTGPGSPLMEACLREGVLYVPGEFCHVALEGRLPSNEIRLCYGVAGPDQIREAVRRLARAAKGLLGTKPAARRVTAV